MVTRYLVSCDEHSQDGLFGLLLVSIIAIETYGARKVVYDLTEKMDFNNNGLIYPNALDRLKWLIGQLVVEGDGDISEVYEVIDYIEDRIHILVPSWWLLITKILLILFFGIACYSLGRPKPKPLKGKYENVSRINPYEQR